MTNWGEDLTILVPADFGYLPGVFALANSALENGFRGRIEVLARAGVAPEHVFPHPQMGIRPNPGFAGAYLETVHRLQPLPNLPPGKYLLLDADVVIERPAGILFAALDEGLVVSAEPESKCDASDVLVRRQCRELGLATTLRPFPYVNCGLLGFMLPRDRPVIEALATLSMRHLKDRLEYCAAPDWYFLEQDILNVLVRQSGHPVFSISPRQLELGASSRLFWDRPFPAESQVALLPKDQLKYIIHGASLRRPWLMEQRRGWLPRTLERCGFAATWRRWRRRITPYERAWAYYACREDAPISLSFWAERHGFFAHRSMLWRTAHSLM